MIRALINNTLACLAAASILAVSQGTANADLMDLFDNCVPNMELGGDTCCTGSTCCYCSCPPAPNMIGDSMGVPLSIRSGPGIFTGARLLPNFYMKVADNNSAVPQDRVYMTYQFFNDVNTRQQLGPFPVPNQSSDMQLYKLGIEKTLMDGALSVDFILPFSHSSDPQGIGGGPFGGVPNQTELQNIAFGLKALLVQNNDYALSAGIRFEAPTADDIQSGASGLPNQISNESWKVTPYLAALYYLSDDTYFQAFGAYCFETSENSINLNAVPSIGHYRDPGFLNLDVQLGHWLYRNEGGRGLTGLQAKIELHYTGVFQPRQIGTTAGVPTPLLVFNNDGEHDILNLTTGITALLNDDTDLTLAMVTPIRDGSNIVSGANAFPSDRVFDYELTLQINHYFGN